MEEDGKQNCQNQQFLSLTWDGLLADPPLLRRKNGIIEYLSRFLSKILLITWTYSYIQVKKFLLYHAKKAKPVPEPRTCVRQDFSSEIKDPWHIAEKRTNISIVKYFCIKQSEIRGYENLSKSGFIISWKHISFDKQFCLEMPYVIYDFLRSHPEVLMMSDYYANRWQLSG